MTPVRSTASQFVTLQFSHWPIFCHVVKSLQNNVTAALVATVTVI